MTDPTKSAPGGTNVRTDKPLPRILLASVFGPYGVDDAYGRKENIMELFHNQVTREQGVFSPRMYGERHVLHMLAKNINAFTTILDFPSEQRFAREIRKDYDYVGISFIVPNFIKAKRMVELVRLHAPRSKVILGGHGANIEGIEKLIPADYICRGEGVGFVRKLLGEDPDRKIDHPIAYAYFNRYVMGVPRPRSEGMIMPGVGCVNGCNFCSTSHFFQKTYTPYLRTGKDVYDVCEKMERELGVQGFFLMDENFLKSEDRCKELLRLMEENGKAYFFDIFSSAETITKLGLDFMERLGVRFLWIGVESKEFVYKKNSGVDFNRLVKDLRDRGMIVLASAILFMDHHTKENIKEDVDFVVGLNADCVQFMQYGPLPGTDLYREYDRKGILRKDIPFEEKHGQKQIWFDHAHFTGEDSEHYLREAFLQDFHKNGPTVLRMTDTLIRGVMSLEKRKDSPFMQKRYEQRVFHAREIRPLLDTLISYAPSPAARELAVNVKARYDAFFGKGSLKLKVLSLGAKAMFLKEVVRSKLIPNNMRQPKTIVTVYGPQTKADV